MQKKTKKRHCRKDTTPKETIKINGKKHTIIKSLDDEKGNVKKQYFEPHIKERKSKAKSPCLDCENNESGWCIKYRSWCNMCDYKCIPNSEPKHTYKYRDKNHKLHILKY